MAGILRRQGEIQAVLRRGDHQEQTHRKRKKAFHRLRTRYPEWIPLWRNREFLKLWIGQTISEIGSRITREGLPLTAVIVLGATPAQMGILSATDRKSVV